MRDWRVRVDGPEPYSTYSDKFMRMLDEFQSMGDGHLGLIIVAKRRIAPLDDNTQSVHSVPYRAGPETQEIERSRLKRCSKKT